MVQTITAELARSVVEGGYASLVLDRLAKQARQVLGVERTSIFVRDRADHRHTIAVATSGLGDDLVGSRFPIAGLTSRVLSDGEPALRKRRSSRRLAGQCGGEPVQADAAAPIEWRGQVRGAFLADAGERERRFSDHELELLSELAQVAGMALSHAERRDELLPTVRGRIVALAARIDVRDGYTAGHSEEVVRLAGRLGGRLGLSKTEMLELELSALLHDVGKIAVPDSILNKAGSLDPDEWSVMRRHPVWGAELLPHVPGLEPVGTIVRYHHERWDGSGYPDCLARHRIPQASRIIAVCDAYHAMTSDRPYRRALPREQAVADLRAGAASQFDPEIVEPLVQLITEGS